LTLPTTHSYFTALVLCPICGTNIGGTILAVEIIRSPTFSSSPRVLSDPRILQGAIYSLALASNIGAMSWTISSSLAGLLWARILKEKGIRVTQGEFARWMLPVLLVLSTVSSAVVLLEVYYFL
jgi:Na+/H+ antiporter NhaD/arsenite permease-like protein